MTAAMSESSILTPFAICSSKSLNRQSRQDQPAQAFIAAHFGDVLGAEEEEEDVPCELPAEGELLPPL